MYKFLEWLTENYNDLTFHWVKKDNEFRIMTSEGDFYIIPKDGDFSYKQSFNRNEIFSFAEILTILDLEWDYLDYKNELAGDR